MHSCTEAKRPPPPRGKQRRPRGGVRSARHARRRRSAPARRCGRDGRLQVEATKYTELGYVGKDVEDIIKDLVEASQVNINPRALL